MTPELEQEIRAEFEKHESKVGFARNGYDFEQGFLAGRASALGKLEQKERQLEVLRHDFAPLQQFHSKHALGPMLPPSCLVCGQQTHPYTRPVAIQHMELPGIVVCKQCSLPPEIEKEMKK